MSDPQGGAPEDAAEPRQTSWAHLTVLSTTLSPTELGDMVGARPDETWTAGERAGAAKRFNGYEVRSRLTRDRHARAHLNDLVSRLDAAKLQRLIADPRVDSVRLWLVIYTTDENPALSFQPDELDAVARLGTGLDVDIYVGEVWFDRASEHHVLSAVPMR